MLHLHNANIHQQNPYDIFSDWFSSAKEAEASLPEAMSVSTVNKAGRLSSRMVLLKQVTSDTNSIEKQGFIFYSNTESNKGIAIAENPQAALLFHWKSMNRQIRIEGDVAMQDVESVDEYFQSRPRESRIGAWASAQSRPMKNKLELQKNVLKYTAKYALGHIPRPAYWQGFRVIPHYIEFWQEGGFRLHDRLVFSRKTINDPWTTQRLYP